MAAIRILAVMNWEKEKEKNLTTLVRYCGNDWSKVKNVLIAYCLNWMSCHVLDKKTR